MTQYHPLPRSSFDAEAKDRPHSRHLPSILSLLRKTRRVCRPLYVVLALVASLLFLQVTFNASYTNPPPFSIPPNENVFIAANIIDENLLTGHWGKSLEGLVHLIGKDRVFVSIYGGPASALRVLDSKLPCNKSLVSQEEDPVLIDSLPHISLLDGELKVKRIAYLAEVRNKALAPLAASTTPFDKVLFINDVFFDPMDAARLIWGTNVKDGKAEYKAACGTDFVTSWKFYDTFATRDLEGYSMGIPIFPWFANEGEAISRNDVLEGRDAVRVKSCWGGIVSFDARYFQADITSSKAPGMLDKTPTSPSNLLPSLPLHFRSEPEPFWEASECCLIHADILSLPPFSDEPSTSTAKPKDTGIYMNPFVRVSYDAKTLAHIPFTKRFERLFAVPQIIINRFAHMPRFNYRRAEGEGDVVLDRIWVPSHDQDASAEPDGQTSEFSSKDSAWKGSIGARATLGKAGDWKDWEGNGHYEDYQRVARRGGYCGVRRLLVMKDGPLEEGEKNWDTLLGAVPPLEKDAH